MDPNWISGLAAVASAGVAIGALVVAARANQRSDIANEQAAIANRRAGEALDLQRRVDEREREFRRVAWTAGWIHDDSRDMSAFTIVNSGLTKACSVTLVLDGPSGLKAFAVGDIAPGQSRRVFPEESLKAAFVASTLELQSYPWEVHWSSPLGAPSSYFRP